MLQSPIFYLWAIKAIYVRGADEGKNCTEGEYDKQWL